MSNKPSLLVYSDCYIYGGSERLMSFLIRNPLILEKYHITFAYRKHKIYQEGINNEFTDQEERKLLFPVRIISNSTLFYKINLTRHPVLLKKVVKIPLLILDKLGIYFVYNILSHISTLKKISPDLIHINNGGYPAARSCNAMVVAAKLLRINNIVYQVNNMAQKRSGLIDCLFDTFINKNVCCFITASKQAKEKLVKERKINRNKILQIPNTIQYESPSLSRDEILNRLNINLTDFVICTVGILTERKGQKYLLKALYNISLNQPTIFVKIRLILVGDGEDEHYLKKYVKEHQLIEHVFFVGYQSKAVNYINACDIFVLPSIASEDMPLVVLSAMSIGKTILSSDFAGIREEIENEISGILVSPNIDTIATDLSDKIIELFNKRVNSYGEEAKKRFNNLFSTQIYGHALVNLYNTVMEQNYRE